MYSTDLAYIHDAGFGAFAKAVAPEIAAILARHGIRSGRIVEVGCGSGAVAGHLARRGYDVHAFDISPAMIRLARARAPGARFTVASLTTARLPRCRAIVSVGEVVTYAPGGIAALRRFFKRAHAALEPGGVLIFDFISSPRGRTYATKSLSGRGWSLSVQASFNRATRLLTRRMWIARAAAARKAGRNRTRRSRETHRVRVYSRREIRIALERYGFDATMTRTIGRRRLIRSDVAVVAYKSGRV